MIKSKFRQDTKKSTPGISTASLPDIVFMLLFFFMVSTVLREKTPLVKTKLPKATEVSKIEKKSWVSYVNIGPPTNPERFGTAPRIQLNDAFAQVDDVIEFVENERARRDERVRNYLTFALKVDQTARMGLVSDVKQELRKSNALKITYLSSPTDNLFD